MSNPAISEAGPEGARPAPDFSEKFDRLKAILRTMFQLDRGDLDFGLYRIMNLKAEEIIGFLDNDLLPQVRTALAGNTANRQAELEKELAKAREQAGGLGVPPETTPKVIDLERQLAEAKADAAAETDVYNHLANFFARYYNEGDFMSLRRYSGGGQPTYLIPYDGEEVKLHWANQDQYYVKSTENYASYVFTVGKGAEKRRVRFEIAKADNEKDNIKEVGGRQRRFLLAESETTKPALSAVEGAVELDNGELVIRFEHRPLTEREKRSYPGSGSKQQDQINEAACKRILKVLEPDWLTLLAPLAPTESNPDRTVLDKHLAVYTAKNSFDYFIHKDLGGFLRRELDLYLKTDVLNLDDLAMGDAARLNRALARMRAVRHVAGKIITFLAQIEDFQKQLWLKKKFVLETQYCVTLDRVPEALYAEIAANDAQHDEWVKLFAIKEIEGDLTNGNIGYTNPLTVRFLKANPFLVLDTRHFNRDFTDRLLAALSDAGPLDEQMDGLLVHGENFQALNLLQASYREQVKCIYIDPPYNTGDNEFLYKDGYQSSSWASMISDRAHFARYLMKQDGLFFMQIGDEERARSRLLLDSIFPDRKNTAVVRRGIKNVQAQFNDIARLSVGHDIIHIYAKTPELRIPHLRQLHQMEKLGKWDTFWRGTDRHTMRYNLFNQFPESGQWRWEEQRALSAVQNYEDYLARESSRKTLDEWYVENLQAGVDLDFVRCNEDNVVQYYVPPQSHRLLSDNWLDIPTAGAFAGFLTEKHLALLQRVITWNTSVGERVLDYFAGSGTTGHAVINLNREDSGRRKYILMEVGHHFDTVLLPRMKKVVYSPDWKDGKPISRDGSTQFFKYVRLESYEDTLDSLEVMPRSSEQEGLLAQNPVLAEDYRLRYALGEETSGSACLLGKHFADPFAYTLSIVRDGVRQEAPVDLPETFNFLIGLRVESRQRIDGVLTIIGTDAEGRRTLILWRNLNEMDNTALEAWFLRHRPKFTGPLDLIYVNGDHTLNALERSDEAWTAKTIEPTLRELMFEGADQKEEI